ncbi:uncharacterized protein [Nicotiana tomentosiformis]|uniref:uncharacterized protein n=1 Tax=Nicotiana tomentosiformis TaxID=4098 RepID=UPI00388C66C7
MAPKKKARTGQRANVTPGVVVDPIFDDAGENPRSENIPPVTTLHDSTTTDQIAPVPTPTDDATLDPPVFTGTNLEEYPQDFIDEMYKTPRVMRATETKAVELASYRLKEVAYSWFELCKESHGEGSPPARWGEFVDAFINHFLPAETKASRAAELENLRQAALNSDMNYGKMVAFAQATETRKLRNRMEREGSNKARSAGNLGGSSGGGNSTFRGGLSGPSQSFAQSSASAPPSGPSSSLSYVTPYVAMEFGIEPEQLHESFSVSTPVGESILAARVYRDSVVTLCGRDTVADLIELIMVAFYVIIGIDWLYSRFAKLDCRTKTVRFEFPN